MKRSATALVAALALIAGCAEMPFQSAWYWLEEGKEGSIRIAVLNRSDVMRTVSCVVVNRSKAGARVWVPDSPSGGTLQPGQLLVLETATFASKKDDEERKAKVKAQLAGLPAPCRLAELPQDRLSERCEVPVRIEVVTDVKPEGYLLTGLASMPNALPVTWSHSCPTPTAAASGTPPALKQ